MKNDYTKHHLKDGNFSTDEENRFRNILNIWTDTKIAQPKRSALGRPGKMATCPLMMASPKKERLKGGNMKLENIKNYLNEKITNSWYVNAAIDYGITGKFIDCEAIGNSLKIIWEEMGECFEMVVDWFTEYSPEQIYNIWMEMA